MSAQPYPGPLLMNAPARDGTGAAAVPGATSPPAAPAPRSSEPDGDTSSGVPSADLDRYFEDGNPNTQRPGGAGAADSRSSEAVVSQPAAHGVLARTTGAPGPNGPGEARQDGVGRASAGRVSASAGSASKRRTRKRVLSALACPPALVAVSVCHTALALTYWVAFASSGNGLYVSVATSYSVVALVSLWKVYETFQKRDGPPGTPRPAWPARPAPGPEA